MNGNQNHMMDYQVEIHNDASYPVDVERLALAATTVLTAQSAAPGSGLTIVITNDQAVADLNQRYRGMDSPTDVLSFPADIPPFDLTDEPVYLGDLVIAYPYALAQAERETHDPGDNLALLVIHGTLHLLGFDHNSAEHRSEMWAAQDTALRALGISPGIVPAMEGKQDDSET
jgi:probable rRNA maturation factor